MPVEFVYLRKTVLNTIVVTNENYFQDDLYVRGNDCNGISTVSKVALNVTFQMLMCSFYV